MGMVQDIQACNVIKKRMISQAISYKEIDDIDNYEIKLWLECINAENAAVKAHQQENNFYAREGIKRV